jgi:hypothetical protein
VSKVYKVYKVFRVFKVLDLNGEDIGIPHLPIV